MKNPMSNWILSKINIFLHNNEGCEIEDTTIMSECGKTVLKDAFGFRYEIQIKVIGRINSDPGDMEVYLQSGTQYGKTSGIQGKGGY